MAVVPTGGEGHEQPILPILMERAAVKRQGRGRPRIPPHRVAGDKGHSSATIRRYLKERKVGAVIPTKADEARDPAFDREAYRERNVVERLVGRLKEYRRIATRYDKLAASYLAFVQLAAVRMWP